MNHIFHYYVTYFIAKKNKFSDEEAEILAYSAQFVDHSILRYEIKTDSGQYYRNLVTHHFGFWDKKQEDAVWIPFHFFPCGSDLKEQTYENTRQDRAWSPEIVIPHSAPAREVLVSALNSRNLFRVGIALHMWADTWAHQNFTGRRDDLNKIPGALPLPAVGHAQAESLPDRISLDWRDGRLEQPIVNNRRRFLDAARSIHKYLATFQGLDFANTEAIIAELESIIGPAYPSSSVAVNRGAGKKLREGIGAIKSALAGDAYTETGLDPRRTGPEDIEIELNFQIALGIEKYDKYRWRFQAFQNEDKRTGQKIAGDEPDNANDKVLWLKNQILSAAGEPATIHVRAKTGFEQTYYYRWNEAAREHLSSAVVTLKNLR